MKVYVLRNIPQVECSGLTVATVNPASIDFLKDFIEETAEVESVSCDFEEDIRLETVVKLAEDLLEMAGIKASPEYFRPQREGSSWTHVSASQEEAEWAKFRAGSNKVVAVARRDDIRLETTGLKLEKVMKVAESLLNRHGHVYLHLDYHGYGSGCSTYVEVRDGVIEISTMDWWPEHAEELQKVAERLAKKHGLDVVLHDVE